MGLAEGRPGAVPQPLGAVVEADVPRLAVGIGELDRVLGGGLVPGSLVLVGGEPGIGKSTLLLQAAAGIAGRLADRGYVLYATGEESAAQVRLRASRLGLLDGPAGTGVRVVAESEVGRVAELARADRPGLVIVDSIQTATVDELDGPAGSVGQVREAALRLMDLAKGDGIAVVLVGHVTKDGTIAGPKTLEHLVDAVLNLEGDRSAGLRLLRASKNRFGSTDEVGVFEMGELGLAELADPARAFLVEHDGAAPGSVVAPTLEGSRPLLVEVQALVAPVAYGTPRRTGVGIDPNRLALLVAVLGRRAGIGLGSHDVYANLAGGLSLEETGSRPAARARPRLVAARPPGPGGERGDRRGRPARRAAQRDRARATAARGGPARLRSGDRAAAARGGPAPGRRRARGRRRGHPPRGDRGRARRRRPHPGDARLTPAPGAVATAHRHVQPGARPPP